MRRTLRDTELEVARLGDMAKIKHKGPGVKAVVGSAPSTKLAKVGRLDAAPRKRSEPKAG